MGKLFNARVLAIALSAILIWTTCILFIPSNRAEDLSSSKHGSTTLSDELIPNLAHFVYILDDPSGELAFNFGHFLCIYAAWYYWQPNAIYLHTNASEEAINKARAGKSGKWSRLIFELPEFRVIPASVPTHATNGVEIERIEHKSDFVRVQAVREHGGTYIDFDAYALRDIKVLRKSGFNTIGGRQFGGQIMSGTFMSKKGSKAINLWAEEMNKVYDGDWTTHSNDVFTRVGERLVAEPGEILIMEQNAFGPGSWNSEDCTRLFEIHNDTNSKLEDGDSEITLRPFNRDSSDFFNNSDKPLAWATDWSKTYVLHAFSPQRSGAYINGFEHITPRYVLESRSDFARAVHPVAKIMYERGLFDVDDPYL